MHEFSIAKQAVDEIIANARDRGAKRICRVELLVGDQNHMGREQLTFWIKEALKSHVEIANDVEIDLKQVPGREFILNRIEIET